MAVDRFRLFAWLLACLTAVTGHADDVRLHYDRSGNIVAIQEADASALAIEDVRPGFGVAGATVTIVGGGFAATPSSNVVTFNSATANASAVSRSSLTVTVPSGATSGPVSVAAGGAAAQSPRDFIILPSNISPATVVEAASLAIDGNPVDIASAGSRTTVVSFRLVQGAHATLQFLALSGTNTSSIPYSIYKPDGTSLVTGALSAAVPSLLLPTAPTSGVYLLSLSPPGWLRARIALATDPIWQVDGASLPISSALQHQLRRAWFSGTAGQNLSYAYTDLVVSPTSPNAPHFVLYKPDGTVLSSLVNLPVTGMYSIVMTPDASTLTTNLNLWLSSEITGVLPFNAPTALSVTRPGQHARYTFSGTQGQYLRLATSSSTTNPANQRIGVSFYNPNGSQLVDTDVARSGTNFAYSIPVLPATGTYTVFVGIDIYGDNQNSTWGTTLTLTPDIPATLAIDGSSTAISTSLLGQEVRATFVASAGQNLGFAYTNLVLTPTTAGVPRFTTYKPDGTVLTSWSNLPATGTYTMYITPDATTTASSMQLWLSSDLVGMLPLGTPTPMSVSRPGQHARYTFQGTQGQVIKFSAASTSTTPVNQRVSIYVYSPSGAMLVNGLSFVAIASGTQTYTAPALPATGSYLVVVQIDINDNTNATWATTLTASPQ